MTTDREVRERAEKLSWEDQLVLLLVCDYDKQNNGDPLPDSVLDLVDEWLGNARYCASLLELLKAKFCCMVYRDGEIKFLPTKDGVEAVTRFKDDRK